MKFKKQLVNIRVYSETDESGILKPINSLALGDYSYHKDRTGYTITHNLSGLAAIGNIPTAAIAREACILFDVCPIKWDGQGISSKEFNNQVSSVVRDLKQRVLR